VAADRSTTAGLAAALRQAFDRSFAEPARRDADDLVELLAVRVGGDPYALPLAEGAGLFAGRPVVPVPGPVPELLGVAGVRGLLVPVYSLRALLGYPGAEAPRWIFVVRSAEALAVAFDQIDGHRRVPRASVAPLARPAARLHVVEAARLEGEVRPIVSLASVIKAIQQRARPAVPPKER
jgi:chemotaxis signal transduction protein